MPLPTDLYVKLKKAADDHSITDLREHIETLSEIENMHAFALHLRELSQRFDICGIQKILEDLQTE
jgi:hypothetical protein